MDYRSWFLFLFFFLPIDQFYAQEKTVWKEINVGEGHCSTNLTLYEDKSYFLETGCEQRSNINLGKWEKNGQILRLSPQERTKVFQTSETSYRNEDSGNISVVDQDGEPISGFDFISFDTRIPIDEIIEEAKQKVNAVGELGLSEIYWAIDTYDGSTGDIGIGEGRVLFLFDLYQLTGEKILLAPEDLKGKHLTLKVNFPAAAFNYSALDWYELPSEHIRLEENDFSFITK